MNSHHETVPKRAQLCSRVRAANGEQLLGKPLSLEALQLFTGVDVQSGVGDLLQLGGDDAHLFVCVCVCAMREREIESGSKSAR